MREHANQMDGNTTVSISLFVIAEDVAGLHLVTKHDV